MEVARMKSDANAMRETSSMTASPNRTIGGTMKMGTRAVKRNLPGSAASRAERRDGGFPGKKRRVDEAWASSSTRRCQAA
jgi:hypothetical protein